MKNRKQLMLVLTTLAAILAVVVFLPASVRAGDLEPPAPPGPTMKTLDEIPPTWSQILPASERFVLVLNDEAVLDKETGLVWERSPDDLWTSIEWVAAVATCTKRCKKGDRYGWRLPTVEELLSLYDPTSTAAPWTEPRLPAGHPFLNIRAGQEDFYWTATTNSEGTVAWAVHMYGIASTGMDSTDPFTYHHRWCVRGGGQGYTPY